MGLVSGTYWSAVCDSCGERVNDDGEGRYTLNDTEQGAREDVEYYDGRFEEDGSITCCSCIDNEPARGDEGK